LLSKFISLIFWYNLSISHDASTQLWFAFEIYIFDILIQPIKRCILFDLVVICFRNLYLWYSDTTYRSSDKIIQSCDLLSKFISLIFWYNLELGLIAQGELWFAFEIYIFDILIQQFMIRAMKRIGCDLLSKFISLIFWYNNPEEEEWPKPVVICFRNLYLWYSDTTRHLEWTIGRRLWFAFEIYIFDILIQLDVYYLQIIKDLQTKSENKKCWSENKKSR
jgi:hypothetical protein